MDNLFINIPFLISIILIFALAKLYSWINSNKNTTPNHKSYEKPGDIKRSYPPFYPNGWLPIAESKDLAKNKILPIFACGNELVIFRTASGKAIVVDAFCPHLGAHFAYGGNVVGDSIKCPFHGWLFNDEGKCTHFPGVAGSHTPKVSINVWKSVETFGIIFVWYHSEGKDPSWNLPIINYSYKFEERFEDLVNCHIQEIPENGADLFHLNEVHKPPLFFGNGFYKSWLHHFIIKYFHFESECDWKQSSEKGQEHTSIGRILIKYKLFGYTFLPVETKVKQIGPALTLVTLPTTSSTTVHVVQFLITSGPLKQRLIHHCYSESSSILASLITKFTIFGLKRMLERDFVIWNTKRFLSKPYLANNEGAIKRFRRWYSQFYSTVSTDLIQNLNNNVK